MFWGFSFLCELIVTLRAVRNPKGSEPVRVAVEGGASGWLLRFSKREFGCEKPAGRTEISYLQYVTLAVEIVERQSELISSQKILPILIIRQWVRQIYIRPPGESLAFRFGRTRHTLIQLKAKDAGRFYLGAERVEQTDVKVYQGSMCLVSGDILGQRWNVDFLRSVACTGRDPIETIISVRRGGGRR